MDAEIKRYVDMMVVQGQRNGLHLNKEKRNQMEAIQKRISALEIDFGDNVNADDTKIEVAATQLKGLQQDFIDALPDGEVEGSKVLTMKYEIYGCCQVTSNLNFLKTFFRILHLLKNILPDTRIISQ